MVIEREYPDLLKEKFMVSQVLRRSEILFWSEDGRGDSQLYCRREYLGVVGVRPQRIPIFGVEFNYESL